MILQPVITWTTDFGHTDAYVAEMKGALLKELMAGCDRAEPLTSILPILIDVTHDIPRHDTLRAAAMVPGLLAAFPPGTLHVMVVDPGVGGSRRALAVESKGQFFVGPDNGLFSPLFDAATTIHAIDPKVRRADTQSRVFDGRDLFAPAAARILRDGIAGIGTPIDDPLRRDLPAPQRRGAELVGTVTYVDHFGNVRTNITMSELTTGSVIVANGRKISFRTTYSDVEVGAPVALLSSNGSIEVAVREGSAADLLGLRVGSEIYIVQW